VIDVKNLPTKIINVDYFELTAFGMCKKSTQTETLTKTTG